MFWKEQPVYIPKNENIDIIIMMKDKCELFVGTSCAVPRNITKTCPCNIQRFFSPVKNENFMRKKFDIFLIFAQNIDCGYTLEPPRRGGSNEYPQSMFWSKNKKK